jgi:hypothetical protein
VYCRIFTGRYGRHLRVERHLKDPSELQLIERSDELLLNEHIVAWILSGGRQRRGAEGGILGGRYMVITHSLEWQSP